MVETPNYRIKLLHINPGQRTSLQRHVKKVETLIFTDLSIKHISPTEIHRLSVHGDKALEVLEVCQGSDDDVERLDDDYGRAGTH